MILLIDIGNTRIKWAQLVDGALDAQVAAAHATWSADTLIESILKPTPRAERVLISNVGGVRLADIARDAISRAWGIEPEFAQSTAAAGGVHNRYADPQKLGVDRWLAMLGARALEQGVLCTVSVGTAMTIDGVDSSGRHLGGVIVPGPELMVSTLLQNTSEIAQRARQGAMTDSLFADNTRGAIEQGAVHALAALIERAVEAMRKDLGQVPKLLLTGGASGRVEKAIGMPYRVVPDLVLRGLAVLATSTQSA